MSRKRPTEEPPAGWRLLVRALPFVAVCVAGAVWGLTHDRVAIAVIGGVGAVAFCWELNRRWRGGP